MEIEFSFSCEWVLLKSYCCWCYCFHLFGKFLNNLISIRFSLIDFLLHSVLLKPSSLSSFHYHTRANGHSTVSLQPHHFYSTIFLNSIYFSFLPWRWKFFLFFWNGIIFRIESQADQQIKVRIMGFKYNLKSIFLAFCHRMEPQWKRFSSRLHNIMTTILKQTTVEITIRNVR